MFKPTSIYSQNKRLSHLDDSPEWSEAILLMLECNLFTQIPIKLTFLCPKLQVLNMNNNLIEILDFSIFSNLSELREIHLTGNKIFKIIESKINLPSMIVLKLNKNKLTDINDFKFMINLEILNLSDNYIENVDTSTFLVSCVPPSVLQLYL